MSEYDLKYAVRGVGIKRFQKIQDIAHTLAKFIAITSLVLIVVVTLLKSSYSWPFNWKNPLESAIQSMADEMMKGVTTILTDATYTTGDAIVRGMVKGFGPDTNLFSSMFNLDKNGKGGVIITDYTPSGAMNSVISSYTSQLAGYSQLFGGAMAIIIFMCGLMFYPFSNPRKNENHPGSLIAGLLCAMVIVITGAKSLDIVMDIGNNIWTNYVMSTDGSSITFEKMLPGDISAIYDMSSDPERSKTVEELVKESTYDEYIAKWFNGFPSHPPIDASEVTEKIRKQFWKQAGWDYIDGKEGDGEPTAQTVTLLAAEISILTGSPVALLLPLILFLIALPLIKGFIQLYVSIIEKYIILCILYFCFPVIACTLVLKNTRRIFWQYLTMFIGEMFILIITVTFMKMTVFGIMHESFTRSVPNYIFGLAFIKVAQGVEKYLYASGLSIAQTGPACIGTGLGIIMMATRAPQMWKAAGDGLSAVHNAAALGLDKARGINDVTKMLDNPDNRELWNNFSSQKPEDRARILSKALAHEDSRFGGANITSADSDHHGGISFSGDINGQAISGTYGRDERGNRMIELDGNNMETGKKYTATGAAGISKATELGMTSGTLSAMDKMDALVGKENFSDKIDSMQKLDNGHIGAYDKDGNVLGTYDPNDRSFYAPSSQITENNSNIRTGEEAMGTLSSSDLTTIASQVSIAGENGKTYQVKSIVPDTRLGHQMYKARYIDSNKRKRTATISIDDVNATHCPSKGKTAKINGGRNKFIIQQFIPNKAPTNAGKKNNP